MPRCSLARTMRKLTAVTLLALALGLVLAATASARRAATGQQRKTIARVLGVKAQCIHVWTSNVRPNGQDWAYEIIFGYKGACSDEQPGDAAFLHLVNGRWRSVVQGDEFGCKSGAVRQVPLRIQADLLGCG